jgi:hypothetical protein
MLQAIASLMRERRFYVEDSGAMSNIRKQVSGISQGCTLSPLLFVVVMSAVMNDAVKSLSPSSKAAYENRDLADIVYADDTLLIGANPQLLNEFLAAVCFAGRMVGLELHADKFQLVQVRCSQPVLGLDGKVVKNSSSMLYLGASLTSDGACSSELSRRIGAAKQDFRALCKVWKQSCLTTHRKLQIYRALVEAKLLYGLSAACFTKAELRRLDGVQAKFLRVVQGIEPSFVSRISNESVRQSAGWMPASQSLLEQQLLHLGKILRSDPKGPLQTSTFVEGTLRPATDRFVRRVGRPRQEWLSRVLQEALRISGSSEALLLDVQDVQEWKRKCRKRCTLA